MFIGTVETLGRRVRFIGKDVFPLADGGVDAGARGVDKRDVRHDTVGQVAAQIASHDRFALIVGAEGTRAPTTRWRTFLSNCVEGRLPIVCAGPNYPRKQGSSAGHHAPGDYDAT